MYYILKNMSRKITYREHTLQLRSDATRVGLKAPETPHSQYNEPQ